MPAFVPIMFELTVFFAAHLMVITFYLRSKLWPFKKAENPNPLTTDDKFLIEVELLNNEKELNALLKKQEQLILILYRNRTIMNRITYLSILIMILFGVQSCYNPSKPNYQYFPNMYEPVGYETYADSDAFANGIEAQLPVEGPLIEGGNHTIFLIVMRAMRPLKPT